MTLLVQIATHSHSLAPLGSIPAIDKEIAQLSGWLDAQEVKALSRVHKTIARAKMLSDLLSLYRFRSACLEQAKGDVKAAIAICAAACAASV